MESMKNHWQWVVAWLGVATSLPAATAQQIGAPRDGVRCTLEMKKRECQQARLDALFKKLDEASAVAHRRDLETNHPLMVRYESAIQIAETENWLVPGGLPNAPCKVHIVQLPGGNIVSANTDVSCPFDSIGQQSVVNAVLRTRTLPYEGFEEVFRRNIDLNFVPPAPAAAVPALIPQHP